MTAAQRIRRAALGPTPKPSKLRMDWIGMSGVWAVGEVLGKFWGQPEWSLSRSVTEKRMFLLFVAEALE